MLFERALNCRKAQAVALIILQQKVQKDKSHTKVYFLQDAWLHSVTARFVAACCTDVSCQYKISILSLHNLTYCNSSLTEIYGNIWCLFIRWWLILQRWRQMERLCVKDWKSHTGGWVKALCEICQGILVDATVSGAGRPEGGHCSRAGVTPT